ncbi:MAG: hypothetical protein O6829_10420 [Alphaproteobacteria bacterium]|nr:hypothetical protein [Alphaproteobacteria bacterium]
MSDGFVTAPFANGQNRFVDSNKPREFPAAVFPPAVECRKGRLVEIR